MRSPPNSPKRRPDHLARLAFISVRQSPLAQVRHTTGSTWQQYDLVQRAKDLGWRSEAIRVIEADQAHSAASIAGRDGFPTLVAEVGLRHAGAVFSLEASRLARSCSAWYRLIEICALTETLVVDEDGGSDPAGHTVLDPDQEVPQAVRLAFAVFDQTGSALAVVKHFPVRHWGGSRDGELERVPLRHGRVIDVLPNPTYTGAYVYGRTETRRHPLPGAPPRITGDQRRVAQDQGSVLLPDAHPAYLTWAEYQRNQQRLDDNRTFRPEERRGAVREGAALLQGIVLCGRSLADGAPCYVCCQVHKQLGGTSCQWVRGDGVDAAVAQLFLAAMHPAQLEISLATLEEVEERGRQIERQGRLRQERAQYEADVARRRFGAVEPENRLVARPLEREGNEKLAAVEALEREYASLPPLTAKLGEPAERERILALAQDLPTLWQAATTTQVERKQLLRFLIKDVTLTRGKRSIPIGVRWQTEALTSLSIPRPTPAPEVRRTDPAGVERVRTLAPATTDQQIAAILNQEGWHAGRGGELTSSKVPWIRYTHGIPTGCPEGPVACPTAQRNDGRYTAKAAATLLHVAVSTIAAWCEAGRLDASRAQPPGPRWIALPPETIAALRKPTNRQKTRHAPP